MAYKIKYGIFPNPQPDAEGNTTYQVRHTPEGTMNEKDFLAHLKYHNTYNTTMMQSSLIVLKDEIIEQLRDNKRFRIDGLGTFQMKVGLKMKYDKEGNPLKPHYTDPNKITANDVEVQGVSFTPDPSFVKALKFRTSTSNKYGRGAAGKNQPYTHDEIINFLDSYLKEHHSMTRRQMERALNITAYRAQKWLDDITAEPNSKYYRKKQGNTYVYYSYE
jgi:nucleoid DNA-binding protein